MLLSVLRLHIETANDHRITLQSVRHRLELHKINLTFRIALRCNLRKGHSLSFHKRWKLGLGILPVLVEVRLHVRSRHNIVRRNTEVERLYSCSHIDLRPVETRLKILLCRDLYRYLTLCRNLCCLLNLRHELLQVCRYFRLDSLRNVNRIRVLDHQADRRLSVPHPVVGNLNRRLESLELLLGLFLLLFVVRTRLRIRFGTAYESRSHDRDGRDKKVRFLIHVLVILEFP